MFLALLPYFWIGRCMAAWALALSTQEPTRVLLHIEATLYALCAIASYALYIYTKDRKAKS